MGKGHLNTKPEHDRMCKAFLQILDILDSGKCAGFSSSEWLTTKDIGNDKAEPSLDSGILNLLEEVSQRIRRIFAGENLMPALWVNLLLQYPQYSDDCISYIYERFSAADWLALVNKDCTRFWELCKRHKGTHKFYSARMAELIIRHPDLAKDCLLYRMTPADWRQVVEKHPQVLSLYRKTCLHSEKSIFNLNKFIDVIRIVPREAWQHVDWAQFYSDGCEDWKCILAQLPDTAPYLGRQFLPDDLLEAMDFIVQHGYDASLYVWTVWRKDIVGFTEKELYSEIEIVERLHHHPELWNVNALVEKIRTFFYGRYEAADKSGKTKVEWLKDIVRKYSDYPLFVSHAIEWFGVGLSWQSWEKLLEFDYSVFEAPCLKLFSCWFNGLEIADLRNLHTDIPSFALWHRALRAVLQDSPLEKRNHEYLKNQLLKLWEERERKKAQRKAREARRRKRFS